MKVDLICVENFSGVFVDKSISPSYTTSLEFADGTVRNLSSMPSAHASFKINGQVRQSASIKGSGRFSLLNPLQYTEFDLVIKSFGLEPVSPYSGKFIGYKIADGELFLTLKYRVKEDMVEGDNRILLDQLPLGDRVDSPEALNLPIALGIALLKDSKGRIMLQIPVEGDTEDPHFDIRQTIISASTGSVHEVGNSPFAAIGEIDGYEGKDLRTIDFEFGFSELNPSEVGKMNALTKFLKERKELVLVIEAAADRQNDWVILTKASKEKEDLSNPVQSGFAMSINLRITGEPWR